MDLSYFRNYKELNNFHTCYSRIQSLHGIENWSRLEKIELSNLAKLTDVSALEHLASHLHHLIISGCKSLTDYSVLGKLKALKRIALGAGPPIKSISFLKDMDLVSGYIGLEIMDKKLDILEEKGIDYWKYKSYKS